jgi:hypothetical protein
LLQFSRWNESVVESFGSSTANVVVASAPFGQFGDHGAGAPYPVAENPRLRAAPPVGRARSSLVDQVVD